MSNVSFLFPIPIIPSCYSLLLTCCCSLPMQISTPKLLDHLILFLGHCRTKTVCVIIKIN